MLRNPPTWTLVLLIEGSLLAAAIVVAAATGGSLWSQYRLDAVAVSLGVLATAPPVVVGLGLLYVDHPAVRRLSATVEELVVSLFARSAWWELALISALAGLAEEAFFRGVIQTAVAGATGPWTGIAVAAILFGLAHPVSPLYMALAASMGAYFGLLYHFSGNLLLPALVHGLYDYVALHVLVRRVRGRL